MEGLENVKRKSPRKEFGVDGRMTVRVVVYSSPSKLSSSIRWLGSNKYDSLE